MTDLALLLFVILAFALLFRGPKTLPKLGGMFGRGVKQVRNEASELTGGTKSDEPAKDQAPASNGATRP